MASKDQKMSKQGTAARGNMLILMTPQKTEIISRL
jgi:hypothetical protein